MAPSKAKQSAPSGAAPVKQKALHRMLNYIAQKVETLEVCYSDIGPDGAAIWSTEMAQREHKTLRDIFQTLTLVDAVERDFKDLLRKKLGKRPLQAAPDERPVASPDEADAVREAP